MSGVVGNPMMLGGAKVASAAIVDAWKAWASAAFAAARAGQDLPAKPA